MCFQDVDFFFFVSGMCTYIFEKLSALMCASACHCVFMPASTRLCASLGMPVPVHMHLSAYLDVSVRVSPTPFLWKSNAAAATSLHIPPVLTPFNQLCA